MTAPYDAAAELTIAWDDPDLGIAWPLAGTPKLSARDAVAPRLRDVPAERLPRWAPPSTSGRRGMNAGRPILLLGATGQVGAALAPRLSTFGAVVAPTRARGGPR